MITIDETICTKCNSCFFACGDGIIAKGPSIIPEADTFCTSCGNCYAICPENAIRVKGFENNIPDCMKIKSVPDSKSLMALLQGRRSVRHFKLKSVTKKHLEEILDAASVAPSSCNRRPVKVYIYTNVEIISQMRNKTAAYFQSLLKFLKIPGFSGISKMIGYREEQLAYYKHDFHYRTNNKEKEDPIFYSAGTVIIFTVPKFDRESIGDAWLAALNAILYAGTIGVGSCFNGYIVAAANANRSLKKIMQIPDKERVICGLVLGYPAIDYARIAPRKRMEHIFI